MQKQEWWGRTRRVPGRGCLRRNKKNHGVGTGVKKTKAGENLRSKEEARDKKGLRQPAGPRHDATRKEGGGEKEYLVVAGTAIGEG